MFIPTYIRTPIGQIGQDIESLNDRVGMLEVGGRQLGIEAVNVQAPPFNVVGDGVTNVREALQSALVSADDSGVTIYLPPGVYQVERFSTLAYSLRLYQKKNLRIIGVRGRTWIRHPAGLPNSSIAVMIIDDCENITIEGVGFDGNWGNEVGLSDSQAGLNHTTQGDPKNYGLMIRGGRNITIRDCVFKQCYGDFIWVGASAQSIDVYREGATNIRILNCDGDMSARSGVALASKCQDVIIDNCRFTNTFASPVDTEPVEQACRNIVVSNCYLSGWWNPSNPNRSGNVAIAISGGKFVAPNPGNYAWNYRVVNNVVRGSIIIQNAEDIIVANNRVVCDWDNYSLAPILVQMYASGIQILNNYIYDRTTVHPDSSRGHDAAIQVQLYGSGTWIGQPTSVRVAGNMVNVRNGRHGIKVEGTGGLAYASGPIVPGFQGVATEVTDSSLTVATAEWIPDQWRGYRVRIGNAHATIVGNTANTLNLWVEIGHTSAWRTALGDPKSTPTDTEFHVFGVTGVVDVDSNKIDCTDDGNGPGGYGVYIYTYRAGMRVRVRGNDIRNASGSGIDVKCVDANRKIISLEISDNKVWDDQAVPTCQSAIQFESPTHIERLILNNNQAGDGVVDNTVGLTSGVWLVNDGPVQIWAGHGEPAHSAPLGSLYLRRDAESATLYVNTSGSTTWTAK